VGGAWLGPNAAESPTTAWLFEILLDEDVRGQGHGRALLAAIETAALAAGYTSVGLNVFGDNRVARQLYETAGYDVRAMQLTKSLLRPADAHCVARGVR
jgi:GNAT superfamily N-acetyltransferase